MIAKLVSKGTWKDGIYPKINSLYYRTRQLIFETETGYVRINVQTGIVQSMEYDKLKIGDTITDFVLLKCGSIINPNSGFVKYNKNALF